jgi:hypothetical protein
MQRAKLIEDWLRLSTATGFLSLETATVIGLRSWLLLTGQPGARDEAVRMIAEKYRANVDLALHFATSRPHSPMQAAQVSVDHYGKVVGANRKRLALRRKSARQ